MVRSKFKLAELKAKLFVAQCKRDLLRLSRVQMHAETLTYVMKENILFRFYNILV